MKTYSVSLYLSVEAEDEADAREEFLAMLAAYQYTNDSISVEEEE